MRALSMKTLAILSRRAAISAVTAAFIAAALWTGVVTPPVLVRASVPQRLFWIADTGAYKRIACEQVAVGTHVTLFNCGDSELAPREAETLIRRFEDRIYPTDLREFGIPHDLGPINIVLAPLSGMTLGYFDENDLTPIGSASSHSNRGNVLYVRSLAAMPDSNKLVDVQETLAHELQHLIDYRVRVVDHGLVPQETWLNEGLSFFAQLSNGFWTPRDLLRLEASAFDPAWSVTAMTENTQFLRQHGRVAYGRAGMFVTFLASQYGSRFTRDLVRTRQTGMKGIDVVLRREQHGTCADAFARWSVAQLLNRPGQYGYKGMLGDHFISARLTYRTVTSYPFYTERAGHSAVVLQPWTQAYMRFVAPPGSPVTIQISAPDNVRLAAVFETAGPSGDSTVRWLKVGASHAVRINIGGYGQDSGAVTIAMSATGSLRTFPPVVGPATVTFRASSVYARHDQRMSGATSAAGLNPDVVL